MTGYLLEMFGISLALTLLLELPIAWILGMRSRMNMLLVLLVNVLTNPAAVLLCWMGMPQLPVEMAVVLTEGLVYSLFSREKAWEIPHPWYLAVVCNAVSWGTGILMQMIGG